MLAKARHPIIENVDLILSLGATRWDVDERLNISETLQATGPISVFFPPPSTTSTSESIDDDGFDLAYGVGLRARVSDSLQLGFEWTRYEVSEFDSHVDLVGVNAEYHFDLASSGSSVLSRYASTTTPILGALRTLWPFNSSAPKVPQWEYFVGISGGIAEHNWVGDQDDEDVSVTDEVLFNETIVTSVDEDATAWKASIGAYVSKYFGFELAYADFGRTSARSTITTQIIQPAISFGGFTVIPRSVSESGSSFRTDAEISSYSLIGLARLPVTSRLELGAKLGATLWDVDGKVIVETSGFPGIFIPRGTGMTPSITLENSGSGVDINYGASMKFNAYRDLWVGIDYSRYEVGDFDEDVDYLALSFEYRFGTLR